MSTTIVTLYALPLIVIWFALWMSITTYRSNHGISVGDAGDAELLLRMRRHGNFIEWVPFVLILMLLAELRGVSSLWLHPAGALLLIGRIAHPVGLKTANAAHPLRIFGNVSNLLAIAILAVALALSLAGI